MLNDTGFAFFYAQLLTFCIICISNEGVGYQDPLLAVIREQTLREQQQTVREQKRMFGFGVTFTLLDTYRTQPGEKQSHAILLILSNVFSCL